MISKGYCQSFATQTMKSVISLYIYYFAHINIEWILKSEIIESKKVLKNVKFSFMELCQTHTLYPLYILTKKVLLFPLSWSADWF